VTSPGASRTIALVSDATLASLYERAGAESLSVTADAFRAALQRALDKRFGGEAVSTAEIEDFLSGLHLEDLALAVACAAGESGAWDLFVRRYQAEMRRAATALGGATVGEEIADAAIAQLFGVDARGGRRRPLFEYFHGRSRLSTWLRSLIAQRHIDHVRTERRLSSLDAMEQREILLEAPAAEPDLDSGRIGAAMRRAMMRAIERLEPRDRLRLACYYAEGLTLATIGRMLSEHEATVSRNLQRTRERIRADVEGELASELGMSPLQVRSCYQQLIDAGAVSVAGTLEAPHETTLGSAREAS
jgi:RNA polymerase sigma-70 factor, ECF subfamily